MKNFGAIRTPAGVDVTIPTGQSAVAIGPSGSGESTLLRCLSGVLPVTSGEITVGGTSVANLNDAGRSRLRLKTLGSVFQDGQLVPELPADGNAVLLLVLAGTSHRSTIGEANSWLTKVGLESERKRRPGKMSSGQAQRVIVARTLASLPSVVFADEPTGALDQATGHEIMRILTITARMSGTILVVITHDPGVATWYDRFIEIRDGHIHADTIAKGARS